MQLPASARPASLTVLASVLIGVLAGLVWGAVVTLFTEPQGDSAATSDLVFGAVALVCGVVIAALVCSRSTPVGLWQIAGLLLGAVLGTAMQWCVGQLLGAPMVRATPVLLAWPIGVLVVIVGALLSGADEPITQPETDLSG